MLNSKQVIDIQAKATDLLVHKDTKGAMQSACNQFITSCARLTGHLLIAETKTTVRDVAAGDVPGQQKLPLDPPAKK